MQDEILFSSDDIPAALCLLSGLIYILNYAKIEDHKRLILIVILLNIAADILANTLVNVQENNHLIYNVMCPLERIVTLMVYSHYVNANKYAIINKIGMFVIALLSLGGFIIYGSMTEFHSITYVLSGMVVAILSYIHLRCIATDRAVQSQLPTFFTVANLLYYTLMISSVSALTLALKIGNDFAMTIMRVNLLGYALWSTLLIIGILWKKRKV